MYGNGKKKNSSIGHIVGQGGHNGQRVEQLLKSVRSTCSSTSLVTVDQAIFAFDAACNAHAPFDALTATSYILFVVKKGNILAATLALNQLNDLGQCPFNPTHLESIITAIPQVYDLSEDEVSEYIDAAVAVSRGLLHTEFFRLRARWAAFEYIASAASTMKEINSNTLSSLSNQGRCIYGCTLKSSSKHGEVICSNGVGCGPSYKRTLSIGDSVCLQIMPEHVAHAQNLSNQYMHMQNLPDVYVYQQQVKALSLIEGEISNVVPLKIKLRDHNMFQKLSQFLSYHGNITWRIDFLETRIVFERCIEALRLLATSSQDQLMAEKRGTYGEVNNKIDQSTHQHILSVVTAPLDTSNVPGEIVNAPLLCQTLCNIGFSGNTSLLKGSSVLNRSQFDAIQAATSRRLTLIQGPPGTGKTATAVKIIQYWVTSGFHTKSILACSDSNIAVDNLLERLIKAGIQAVRVGNPDSTRPELLKYSVDEIANEATNTTNSLDSKQTAYGNRQKAMKNAQVICATCSGVRAASLNKVRLTGVLIDEATQATELATLIALTRGCQQLVLVGDQCQLPPVVKSAMATSEGYNISLFERIMNMNVAPLMLNTQYRMHPHISKFPSDAFYGGALYDGILAKDRPLLRGFDWPKPDIPVAFVNVTDAREERQGESKLNTAEAQAVAKVVKGLIDAGLPLGELGVITPYSAQVRVLKQLLGSLGNALEIASVDGFQGREKSAIVISTVRSNASGALGFLADWRRTNVALTRAQRGLVVVGHAQTLASDKRSWQPWLNWAYESGIVIGEKQAPKGTYDQETTRKLAQVNIHLLATPPPPANNPPVQHTTQAHSTIQAQPTPLYPVQNPVILPTVTPQYPFILPIVNPANPLNIPNLPPKVIMPLNHLVAQALLPLPTDLTRDSSSRSRSRSYNRKRRMDKRKQPRYNSSSSSSYSQKRSHRKREYRRSHSSSRRDSHRKRNRDASYSPIRYKKTDDKRDTSRSRSAERRRKDNRHRSISNDRKHKKSSRHHNCRK